ncbi:MAG TPA: hypothetical protein VEG35_02320 [Burkholderiales bacterium]|nr:hypothetical protein [Burkholderiales bacterium]
MDKKLARLLLFGFLGAASARAQTVNCLVAVVGGQPVTLTDLRVAQEFGLFDRDIEGVPGDQTLAVLEAIIGQKLVLAMAREPGTVGRDELEQALASLRERFGPEVFAAKLRRFGLREADLRPYLEERLHYDRVVSARFAAPVPFSRGDVEKFYRDVYVPGERAKGLQPAPLDSVLAVLEARVRASLRARKVADWVRTIRAQAEVRVNRDCFK